MAYRLLENRVPRKRSSSTAKVRQQAANIARLRKVGLTKSTAGKSGKRMGGSAYALMRKFKDVIDKRAAVIKAPAKVARDYKGTFQTTRNKIIVPKSPGERVSLKANTIRKRKVVVPGERPVNLFIPPNGLTLTNMPRGPGYSYRIWEGRARRFFATYALLEEYLSHYGHGHKFNVGRIEVIPPDRRGRRNVTEDEEDEE